MQLRDLEGQKVAVWGSGREAAAFVRALHKRHIGAVVKVLDESAKPGAMVEDVAVLPFSAEELQKADVVVRSPGVSIYRPELEGLTVTTATNLWFAEQHAPVIAYTGTKGKSTSTALTAHLINGIGKTAKLAGNIGRSPLDLLDEEEPDWWVLEMSSFQASDLTGEPKVGALTSFSPEHLDWHGTEENYKRDKLRLLSQSKRQVLNSADPGVAEMLWEFPDAKVPGIEKVPPSNLLGPHNEQLIRLVLAVLNAAGIDYVSNKLEIDAALATFEPLPHRLEPVGERNGVLYVNDSLSTTPIATMAAVTAFDGRPLTVLVGGYDRGISYDEFGEFLHDKPNVTVITLPDCGDRIAEAITGDTEVIHADDLEEALSVAANRTPAGGVVLMSPGAASFGHFKDYADRGDTFRRLVSELS